MTRARDRFNEFKTNKTMREILFRGKDIDTKEWLIGHYNRIAYCDGKGLNSYIKRDGYAPFEVDDNTIGQYIGLQDKNGTKIFEGDICEHIDKDNYPRPFAVEWIEDYACFAFVDKGDYNKKYFFQERHMDDLQIIGNIYKNRNLLK